MNDKDLIDVVEDIRAEFSKSSSDKSTQRGKPGPKPKPCKEPKPCECEKPKPCPKPEPCECRSSCECEKPKPCKEVCVKQCEKPKPCPKPEPCPKPCECNQPCGCEKPKPCKEVCVKQCEKPKPCPKPEPCECKQPCGCPKPCKCEESKSKPCECDRDDDFEHPYCLFRIDEKKIELKDCKEVISAEVFHKCAKVIDLCRKKIIVVKYGISVCYIDECCNERECEFESCVIFNDVDCHFCFRDFQVFVKNPCKIACECECGSRCGRCTVTTCVGICCAKDRCCD